MAIASRNLARAPRPRVGRTRKLGIDTPPGLGLKPTSTDRPMATSSGRCRGGGRRPGSRVVGETRRGPRRRGTARSGSQRWWLTVKEWTTRARDLGRATSRLRHDRQMPRGGRTQPRRHSARPHQAAPPVAAQNASVWSQRAGCPRVAPTPASSPARPVRRPSPRGSGGEVALDVGVRAAAAASSGRITASTSGPPPVPRSAPVPALGDRERACLRPR